MRGREDSVDPADAPSRPPPGNDDGGVAVIVLVAGSASASTSVVAEARAAATAASLATSASRERKEESSRQRAWDWPRNPPEGPDGAEDDAVVVLLLATGNEGVLEVMSHGSWRGVKGSVCARGGAALRFVDFASGKLCACALTEVIGREAVVVAENGG